MAKRSLKASPDGAQLIRKAFNRKGWTQENLAAEVDLKTRQPIWRFFTCRPIERHIFIELCSILDLNWWEVAEHPPEFILDTEEKSLNTEARINEVQEIDVLVQQVRSQHRERILGQCESIKILDTNRLVKLNDIYVNSYFLDPANKRKPSESSEIQDHGSDPFNQFHTHSVSNFIPDLELLEYGAKLQVLGLPGSGKTMFLKHVAFQCIQGKLAANVVPIFISLRHAANIENVAAFDLLSYIHQELRISNIKDDQIVEMLLNEGRVLLLLDGIHEIQPPDRNILLQEINRFSEQFYKNRYILTARSSKFEFPQWLTFEICPFNQEQIAAFAIKWFNAFSHTGLEEISSTAEIFIQKLNSPKNRRFQELAALPLLLNYLCHIFAVQGAFHEQRNKIYERCLDLLLNGWSERRFTHQNTSNHHLSTADKLDILSDIAIGEFESGRYAFEQRRIEQYVGKYIHHLPTASLVPQSIQAYSKAVLNDIALQHELLIEREAGVFTFSHIALQEYFVAKKIASSYDSLSLKRLTSHLANPRWREIFVLLSAMLCNPNMLLQSIQRQIDLLCSQDEKLRAFSLWKQNKRFRLSLYSHLIATYITYRSLASTLIRLYELAFFLSRLIQCIQKLLLEIYLDAVIEQILLVTSNFVIELSNIQQLLFESSAIALATGNTNLSESLQQLASQLKDIDQNRQNVDHSVWLSTAGELAEHFQLTENLFPLDLKQQQSICHYYYLIDLLKECLDQVSNGDAIADFRLEHLIPLARVDPKQNSYGHSTSKRVSSHSHFLVSFAEVKSKSLVAL